VALAALSLRYSLYVFTATTDAIGFYEREKNEDNKEKKGMERREWRGGKRSGRESTGCRTMSALVLARIMSGLNSEVLASFSISSIFLAIGKKRGMSTRERKMKKR